jgi:hypothetical protein
MPILAMVWINSLTFTGISRSHVQKAIVKKAPGDSREVVTPGWFKNGADSPKNVFAGLDQ